MSNQLNLPQLDNNHVVEKSPRMINGNRTHLSAILSFLAKGLNTYVNKVFQFSIFNTFEKKSKNLFTLRHYGVLCVD